MYLISWLPYQLQMWMGKYLGRILLKVAKKRAFVAKRNLELCFPDMPEEQRHELLKKNFENTGMAMFESSMAWFWPLWRINRLYQFEGEEHLQKVLDEGKGVLAISAHFLSLEMGSHSIGQKFPMVGFYRRHNNPVMEWVQYHGRVRSNKYLVHKKNIKGLLEALDNNEVCIYLPDHDYGRKRAEFVPFFAVQDAATTTGTMLFAGGANCKVVPVFSYRLPNNSGYKLKILPALDNFPTGDDKADCIRINKVIEEVIMEVPEQYMWLHKRFKTRPDPNMTSYY